tara:strand:+ start:212 stop:619 length:408 start_codon:yes stop_codon:yes gene_type:complete
MNGTSSTQPRYLVFVPKGLSSADVARTFAEIRKATPRALELVDSLTWYNARFAACGNWDSWALEAVTGRSYRDRRPYFDGFITVMGPEVGQGTSKVLALSLKLRKPVYWLSEKKLLHVTHVESSGDTGTLTPRVA